MWLFRRLQLVDEMLTTQFTYFLTVSDLHFPLTCFDAVRASRASRAERATPAGDGWHGSVGVATDPAGITVTRRRHRVAVGGVCQLRGVGHLWTQQLGASHPIRA